MTGFRAPCPYRDCKTPVSRSKFLCPYHWRLVPADLRNAVYAAWRNYPRDPRTAAGELIVAQQEALEAIGGK